MSFQADGPLEQFTSIGKNGSEIKSARIVSQRPDNTRRQSERIQGKRMQSHHLHLGFSEQKGSLYNSGMEDDEPPTAPALALYLGCLDRDPGDFVPQFLLLGKSPRDPEKYERLGISTSMLLREVTFEYEDKAFQTVTLI
jgi:hypothetical protein